MVEAKGSSAAAAAGGEVQEQGGAGLESADGDAHGGTDARAPDARTHEARKPDPLTVGSLASVVEGDAPSSAVSWEEGEG